MTGTSLVLVDELVKVGVDAALELRGSTFLMFATQTSLGVGSAVVRGAKCEVWMPDSEDAESLRFYKLVGAKVRSARIAARLSQALLAEQVGLTRSSVANLEAARQRTSLYHFVLISRALMAEVGELLPDEPSSHDSQLTSSLQDELADEPETIQEFVRGAVARLQSTTKTEIL